MIPSHLGIVSHQSGCDFDASEQVMKRHQSVNQLKKNYTFWNFSLGRDFFEKLVSFLCIRIGSRSISGTTGSVHASLFAYICNDSVSSAKPHSRCLRLIFRSTRHLLLEFRTKNRTAFKRINNLKTQLFLVTPFAFSFTTSNVSARAKYSRVGSQLHFDPTSGPLRCPGRRRSGWESR